MKKNLSNQYISNIFSEHPIASWSLDDNFHYLSIDKNYATNQNIAVYAEQQVDGTYEDFINTNEIIPIQNLITDNPSFEEGTTTGWTSSGMSISAQVGTDQYGTPYAGSRYLRGITTSTGTGKYIQKSAVSVTAGKEYTFAMRVWLPNENSGSNSSWSLTARPFAGSTALTAITIDTITFGENNWAEVRGTFTAPETATSCAFRITNTTSFTTTGQRLHIDGALLYDSRIGYVSYFDTQGGFSYIYNDKQDWYDPIGYSEISGPYESSPYSLMRISKIDDTGVRKKKIGRIVKSFTLNGSGLSENKKISLSTLFNLKNSIYLPATSNIVSQTFGCFLAEEIEVGLTKEYRVISEKTITVDQAKYFDWYSPQSDLEATIVKDESKTYYVGFFIELTGPSVLSEGEYYGVFVNGYDVAKFADIGLTDGPGETILPASSSPVLSSYLGSQAPNFGYIKSETYNNDEDYGYLLIHNPTNIITSTPLCSNSRLPIVIGSESALTIHNPPTVISDKASAIYPGKSFMHESGNGSSFTAEFWIQAQKELELSDSSTNLSDKIIKVFGPLDNSINGLSSGVYVGSNSIYLKVGNKLKAHYIGMIDRPMLIQWAYDKTRHSLFVNGEEVLSFNYEESDLVDLDGKNFIGFFATGLEKIKVSCFSIYPYKVNDVIAKRRFVYGQGTQSLENLSQSYYGNAITADFSKSSYYNTISFPDSSKWESGFFSNLSLTKDKHLSFPNYTLPDLVFVSKKNSSGIDISFIPTISQYKEDMLDTIIADSATESYIPVSYFKTTFNPSEKQYSKFNANIKYSELYSYLKFNKFNFIDNKINSIMFDVNIFSSTENNFILFNLSNSAGAYLEARSIDNVITLSFYNNKTGQTTIIDTLSPENSVRQIIFYNIENIIDSMPELKNTLSQFFSNRSELSLSLFGKEDGSQFSGKIFSVGFNNNIYTDKIQAEFFRSLGNIDPSLMFTYSYFSSSVISGGSSSSTTIYQIDGGTSLEEEQEDYDLIDGGNSSSYSVFEPVICNYTIKPTSSVDPSNKFFDLDVASVGYWETYLPASTFHKKMQGIDGEEYYDTGSIQINFNAENQVEQYYTSLETSVEDRKRFLDIYDSNNVKVKLSIVDSSNYGNPRYVPENSDIVYNVLNGDQFDINTEYSVFNDNLIHLPDYFEEGVHYLKVSIEAKTYMGINLDPIVMKYLHLSTLPNKNTTFEKFEIGTRFGNPAYVTSKRGTDLTVPQLSNSTVSMFYDQYLFNAKNSGFSVYETINNSYLNQESFTPEPGQDFYIYNKNQNGLQFPVDRSNSLLKLTGLTLFANINDYYPEKTNAFVKIVNGSEIKHIKVGELILTDDNESLKINLVLEELSKQFNNDGTPGKTRWKFKAVDDRNAEYDFISFYQNGKKVNNPVLSPMEWSHLGIVFIGTYPSYANQSYLFVGNMLSVNNISFHELGKQAQDISLIRSWNQVLYNEDYTAYKDWRSWKYPNYPDTSVVSDWSSVLFLTSGASEFLDVERYYSALTSNNIIYSEDTIAKDAINLTDETSVSIFTDINWSNILKYPV
jgi:hypothetical protein